jgi:cellulose synthase/poly-beta-1,6-N-acetylglucosamine synthase-like glycosyltransferase
MNFDQPLTPSRSNLPLVFHGYEEVQPTNRRCDDNFYFPVSAERNATISKEKKSRRTTVAITIPCYNEEAESLRRTLKCLSEQDLPDNIHIETVIVMDGATQISESMNLYLEELFQLDPTLDPFFSRFDKNINTVIIEPTFTYDSCDNKANSMMEKCDDACSISDDPDEQPEQVGPSETSHPDLHLSLVVKRNNQRKVRMITMSCLLYGRLHHSLSNLFLLSMLFR